MLLLHKNPILYRELRPRVRPSKLLALVVAVLGFLALALTYLILMVAERRDDMVLIDWRRVWREFATVVMVLQVFCGFYVTLGVAANSIAREKGSRTYDFLTTLPVGPADKAVGLALGMNLYSLMILATTLPVALAAGLAGGYSLVNLLWFCALMGAFFLVAGMLGVALGSGLTGGILGWLIVLVILGFDLMLRHPVQHRYFTVIPLLSVAPYATLTVLLGDLKYLGTVFRPGEHHFFGWSVPWQVSPLVFLAFLWVLGFALARRKLSRPGTPPLDRPMVLGAFVVFQMLLLGFLADALTQVEGPSVVPAVFFVLNFLFILFWAMTAQPTYAGLMAWAGRGRHWLGRLVSQSVTSVLSPSILAGGLMWVVATAAIWAMDRVYWQRLPWQRILGAGGILLIFLLAYGSLYTVGCAASRRNGKALGLILVAVSVVIPVIFSTLEGYELLLNATPLSLFGETADLLDPATAWLKEPTLWRSLSFAAGELAVFGALCLAALAALARRAPGPAVPQPVATSGDE